VSLTVEEVMNKLEALGSEQTRKTFRNRGAVGPLFGVKVGDLKPLVKEVKRDQALVLALYDTGNSDAMYLAGLSVNPKTLAKETLQQWAGAANWYMIAEYTVAWVAAESPYALELAREWMASGEEWIAVAGWSTYANYLSITPNEELDLEEIRRLLELAERTIHGERNRVRYNMNTFVIAVGSYVPALFDEAMETAEKIGKVEVNVGRTACKVPLASAYIRKVEEKGMTGKKKKTCRC